MIFFGSIGSTLAQKIKTMAQAFDKYLHKNEKIASSILMLPPTINEIFIELNKRRNKKSPGPFKLDPYFVKIASPVIASFVTYLTEANLNMGFF